jgi:hypothetical protein
MVWPARPGIIAGRGALTPAAGGGAYVGPLDTNPTNLFGWWGLRAASAAKCGTKAIRIVRASDSAQTDINSLADGTLDVATAATFMAATTAKVVTFYDQSGALKSFGAALDLTQATDGSRAAFILNANGSLPAVRCSAITQLYNNSSGTVQSAVTTVYAAFKRTGDLTVFRAVLSQNGAGWQIGAGDANNKAHIYAGTFVTVTATDNAWHTLSAQLNGASTVASVDGSTSTVSPGTQFTAPNYTINIGGFIGDFFEAGIWQAAKTVANAPGAP